MYVKNVIILISTIICLSEAAVSQNIKQSVQTALENNENLKSQKALLDNSYQNFLIQKGRMFPSLSLSGTGTRSSNFNTNQDSDSYSCL